MARPSPTPFFAASPVATPTRASQSGSTHHTETHTAAYVQPKLEIGTTGDPFEREADDVAERVVQRVPAGPIDGLPRSSDGPPAAPRSTPSTTGAAHAPSSVERVLSTVGAPMPAPVRREMEDAFGRDFSGVRIHADGSASASARAISASAYTSEHHVVFAEDRFAPGTVAGRRLLAHELTHVVQQGAATGAAPPVQRQEQAPAAEDTSLSGRMARATIARVAGAAASVMRRALPVPIPESIMAALVAAIASFLHRGYVRLAQRGEALAILGRVRELADGETALAFYGRYLWGLVQGLVSPITGLVHLGIGAVRFHMAAVEWLTGLPERAPELITEAGELRAGFEAFGTRAQTTLAALRTREQVLAFAGAVFAAAAGASEAMQRRLVEGAQQKGEEAADSLVNSLLRAPLPQLAETAGEVVGTVVIELVLLLFTEGIGNLITKLGELAKVLRPLSSGVAAFARVAGRIGRLVAEFEHIVGVFLSKTVLRPLMPIFEALQPLLTRMQRFAQRLVGIGERSAAAVTSGGMAAVEGATPRAAQAVERTATPPRRPPPPPAPPAPPPRPPRSRGATAEGVGDSFRYEHHPPPAVEPRVETRPSGARPARPATPAPSSPGTRAGSAGSTSDDIAAVADEATAATGRGSRSPSDWDELNAPGGSRATDPSDVAGLRPRFADDRFHWKMAEEDLSLVAQELFPGRLYDPATQGRIIYSRGRPVARNVAGSTIPDLYLPGTRRTRPISLDAKSRFLGDPQLYDDFIVSTVTQARQRAAALPRTTEQHLVLDFRGQQVTREFVAGLKRDLARRSEGLLRYERIHAWPLSLN